MSSFNFSSSVLSEELSREARSLNIPSNFADDIIKSVISATEHWLSDKTIITKKDLDGVIASELSKYHPDFAYIYRNRDKII